MSGDDAGNQDEDSYSDNDGGDIDYSQVDDPTEDEGEDNDVNADDQGRPAQKSRAGKGAKRDRSDTLFAAGTRAGQKKKSKQDLRGQPEGVQVEIDLTDSLLPPRRKLPWQNRPEATECPKPTERRTIPLSIYSSPRMIHPLPVYTPGISSMTAKATENQIAKSDRATFNLAKPILATMIYLKEPWPCGSNTEIIMCDEAWRQALKTQSIQMRAVGAIEIPEEEGGPCRVMDSITRGIVSLSGAPGRFHC